jgi:hypothetical protein
MAEIPNRPNPLKQYSAIEATTISGSTIALPVNGTFKPPTGSASGSLVASLTMKVQITGSTYYIQLWR